MSQVSAFQTFLYDECKHTATQMIDFAGEVSSKNVKEFSESKESSYGNTYICIERDLLYPVLRAL